MKQVMESFQNFTVSVKPDISKVAYTVCGLATLLNMTTAELLYAGQNIKAFVPKETVTIPGL